MLWLRTWKLGTKSLALHPLRTGLTMLGIMIGVWAVIVLTAISQGASEQVQKQIESLGSTTIIVRSQKPTEDKLQGSATKYGLCGVIFSKYLRMFQPSKRLFPFGKFAGNLPTAIGLWMVALSVVRPLR